MRSHQLRGQSLKPTADAGRVRADSTLPVPVLCCDMTFISTVENNDQTWLPFDRNIYASA
jgi:hypothetical protein